MATNIPPVDEEEALSQALSWETCSQSSWSLACDFSQQALADGDRGLRNLNIGAIPQDHASKFKTNVQHTNPDPEPKPARPEIVLSTRYLQARPPLREDGNPKGKHPRKPLPSWRLSKLKRISNRACVAEDYRELIWREQREQERLERKLARGEIPHKQGNRVFSGRPSPAKLKKKKAQMTRQRKNERKRANRTSREDTPRVQGPQANKKPPPTIPANKEILERKKWMEGYIKPHYFMLFDALARQKGHAEFAWGCDYCELRLRQLKTSRFKAWKTQTLLDGVNDLGEHDRLAEIIRNEVERFKLEDNLNWREQVSMEEIVRWREEPVYVVRNRSGKSRGGRKLRRKEAIADDALDSALKGRNEAGSEDEWVDLEWDKSDGSGSGWAEVWSDDGKIQ